MVTLGLLHRERLRLTIGLRNVVFTFPQTTSKLKWNQNEWTHRLFLVKFSRFTFFLCEFKLLLKWTKLTRSESWQILTLWWQTGGVHPPPQINFSSQWGEVLFQTNFVFVGTSLGHLSMKKNFRSDLPCLLKRKVLGTPPPLHGHWVTIDLFFWPWRCI